MFNLKTLNTNGAFLVCAVKEEIKDIKRLKNFVNDIDKTHKQSAFEIAVMKLGIKLRRTRLYSPWQNGKVERSHREDGKILYSQIFTNQKELLEKVAFHEQMYNNTAKFMLNFCSPNQLVDEFFNISVT